MKPWARYDRDFPDDEKYFLAMPERHRAAAYALLLAINGRCYKRPATGRLARVDADALAYKLGQNPRVLIPILADAKLIELNDRHVYLPRFFEWNPELRPDISEKRSGAGKAGAAVRWGPGRTDGTLPSASHGGAHGNPDATPIADIQKQRETETERLESNPLTMPSAVLVELNAKAKQLCEEHADRVGLYAKRPAITAAAVHQAISMLEMDGRPFEEALELIDWATQDGFWRSNVLSMRKFREHYDQLRLRRQEERPRQSPNVLPVPTTDDPDAIVVVLS